MNKQRFIPVDANLQQFSIKSFKIFELRKKHYTEGEPCSRHILVCQDSLRSFWDVSAASEEGEDLLGCNIEPNRHQAVCLRV